MIRGTVADDVRATAAEDPGGTAVVTGDRSLSFAELDRLAGAVAGALRGLGVDPTDRVVVVLPNSIEAVVAIEGVLRAGVLVPLNPTIKPERLGYVLRDVEAAAVICDSDRAGTVREALETDIPVIDDVRAFAESGESSASLPVGTDLAAVLYTSGSTGTPKGAMLTHSNLGFVTGSIVDYLELSASDRVLCLLQLSFGYGLSQLLTCMRVGATLVVEEGIAFPGKIVQALEDHAITGLAGVPTIFQVLVSLRGLADRKLEHLRFLTNAGASMPAATVTAVRETFPGADLYLMYGLTECIRVSYLPPEELESRPTSSGIPIPGTEAWVSAADGGEAAAGEVGELIVRGPHVMQGYWRDPGGTADRLHPGRWPWERTLVTGDLFRRDDDGFLHWVGRTDDLIKSRGEKVYPREVEEVLHAVEGVAEAAVVGVDDRLLGQAVHAHAAPAPGASLDEAALRRRCAEMLEDHKVPQRVFLYDTLPRTPRGKIDRQALIERGIAARAGTKP